MGEKHALELVPHSETDAEVETFERTGLIL